MKEFLWLIPTLPFAGALILICLGLSNDRKMIPLIGAGSVGLSALATILLGIDFLSEGQTVWVQRIWTWIDVANLKLDFALYLDSLSLVFIFVITFVGFLIHLYSAEFMREDEGYGRFFIYLNLFVGSMLILVLADNLMLMYLGWEGVGLCSYLLIGFWYREDKNGYAARKAFIMTRVGDTALAIALFILFTTLGTLNIQEIAAKAPQVWAVGSSTIVVLGFLLLGGAVGKSAQLPLQAWLPDAMAGPSPVSALIHAATMVTAGVYLITRMHVIFELAPLAQMWVGIIGALTLLIAGFSALTQNDLKRILAYSTISQIGYMFLALGIGAWSAAIFHFMIHAFFKALLFLGAGAVILLLHHEHNIFRMGGLRKKMPVIFWTFLIGSASLAALPVITGGFYSKDQILWLSLAGEKGNIWFFLAALAGAFLTAMYTFRMVFVAFFGEEKTHVAHDAGNFIKIPLITLAVLSTFAGFLELPHTMAHLELFSDLLAPVLPSVSLQQHFVDKEIIIQAITAGFSIGGVYVAYYVYMKQRELATRIKTEISIPYNFWYSGWGFDAFYNAVFVRPFVYLSNINKNDGIDKVYDNVVRVANFFNRFFSATQSGIMRWYMMGIVIGTLLVVTLSLLMI